jgi:hypothetical protein
MAAITIDMIRTNHRSTDGILKMLLHLGYFTEHGTYQLMLTTLWRLVEAIELCNIKCVPKEPKAI